MYIMQMIYKHTTKNGPVLTKINFVPPYSASISWQFGRLREDYSKFSKFIWCISIFPCAYYVPHLVDSGRQEK